MAASAAMLEACAPAGAGSPREQKADRNRYGRRGKAWNFEGCYYLDLQNLLAEEALPRALSLPLLEELTEASVQSVWAGDMGRRKTPRVRTSSSNAQTCSKMAFLTLTMGERDTYKEFGPAKSGARPVALVAL